MKMQVVSVNNELRIEKFDEFKEFIVESLRREYPVCTLANKDDYAVAKGYRAELNKLKDNINDTKIEWVKDVTGLFVEQVKTICQLIDEKAKDYDNEIKGYEYGTLGKEKPTEYVKTITIKLTENDDIKVIEQYLKRKGVKYSIK